MTSPIKNMPNHPASSSQSRSKVLLAAFALSVLTVVLYVLAYTLGSFLL
ncbi:hypothetical protein [Arthrobacter sp. CAN_C5]|nr:hypothetical protein [Arthrobacter sp. CAN_C5]MBP2216049.1 hypothetical protein [Arthrobacter sp. CAN_C5]